MSETLTVDLAIIGAGSGGLSLAAGAAQLGLKVVLVESGKMGGDCLNYGCVPSKALLAAAKRFYQINHSASFGIAVDHAVFDFKELMKSVHEVIAKIAPHDSIERFESLGVKVIQAKGQFLRPDTLIAQDTLVKAKHFVIATGSSPAIPPIPGLEKTPFLTNETIFNLKELPEHLIVIGGGPIGCELAQAFAMLGSKVTLLEGLTLLAKDDSDAVSLVRESMQKMGVEVYEQARVLSIDSDSRSEIKVSFEHEDQHISCHGSHLLIATGRQANVNHLHLENAKVNYSIKGIEVNEHLQSSNKKIYAIGDVVGPYQLTHMANYQAGIVLRNILFKWPAKVDYRAVPWVTYTEPELAHVGLQTNQAENESHLVVSEYSFADNDRARAEGMTQGKIKVITDKKGTILGATIVGSQAGELLLPWVMAIREKKTLRSFTDLIAPYPTLSELSKQVAGAFYKPKLFSKKVKWLVSILKKFG